MMTFPYMMEHMKHKSWLVVLPILKNMKVNGKDDTFSLSRYCAWCTRSCNAVDEAPAEVLYKRLSHDSPVGPGHRQQKPLLHSAGKSQAAHQ